MKNSMPEAKRRSTRAFLNEKEVDFAISQARLELGQLCDDLFAGKIAFNYGNQICTGTPLDFHRCLAGWSQDAPIAFAIRNTILSSFYSTDVILGGSGLVSCLLWTGRITLPDESMPRYYAYADEADGVIDSWARGGLSSAIAKKLIRIGACGSSVNLQEGQHLGTVITAIQGAQIPGMIDQLFDSKIDLPQQDGNFYGVAIDGIVESMGQIHKLLDEVPDQKIVILARGFLPDVSNTLAENWSSGRLNVIPFVITDWGTDNFLDLVAAGFECVSTATGSEIQKARLQKLIPMTMTKEKITYQAQEKPKTELGVSFGKDLGSLKGLSIDRTKTLLALGRFAARSGVVGFDVLGHQLIVPSSVVVTAVRAEKSLRDILQNIGGIITSNPREVIYGSIRGKSLSGRHRQA